MDAFAQVAETFRIASHSAPLTVEQFVEIACRVTLKHVGDCTRSLMGEDRQGFALPMVFLHARHILLAGGIVPEKQHGGFGEGPCERRMADFRAESVASRCLL